jgi:hypothetical protein
LLTGKQIDDCMRTAAQVGTSLTFCSFGKSVWCLKISECQSQIKLISGFVSGKHVARATRL